MFVRFEENLIDIVCVFMAIIEGKRKHRDKRNIQHNKVEMLKCHKFGGKITFCRMIFFLLKNTFSAWNMHLIAHVLDSCARKYQLQLFKLKQRETHFRSFSDEILRGLFFFFFLCSPYYSFRSADWTNESRENNKKKEWKKRNEPHQNLHCE